MKKNKSKRVRQTGDMIINNTDFLTWNTRNRFTTWSQSWTIGLPLGKGLLQLA